MNKKSVIGAVVIVVLGLGVSLGYKLLKKDPPDSREITETIRIAGDNYLGYWFLSSTETRKQAREQEKLGIEFTADNGDYPERLKKFAAGEYDAIVLPINSYLQHGASHNYPGVIVASICESKGADGIVVFEGKNWGSINSLNDPKLKFVFTGGSPSEFLLDVIISDFGLDQLLAGNSWRNEAAGSEAVYEMMRKKQGDVFVLWEPDLSKALALPNAKYLWGSEKFSGLIVDVFVVRRDFLANKPAVVRNFLKVYFRALEIYANNRERMVEDMALSLNLKKEMVEPMLSKIDWFNVGDNARLQFGIPLSNQQSASDGVVNTIIACTKILKRTGKLAEDPLRGDPFLITNRSVIKELVESNAVYGNGTPGKTLITFSRLGEDEWGRLKEVGTMRMEPIPFRPASSQLEQDGRDKVDEIARMLAQNYPNYRIIIRGHTGLSYDEEQERENQKLSLERAQAVLQQLVEVHKIDPDRLRAEGKGSSMKPPRKPGESQRQYESRLPRVEFILVEANSL